MLTFFCPLSIHSKKYKKTKKVKHKKVSSHNIDINPTDNNAFLEKYSTPLKENSDTAQINYEINLNEKGEQNITHESAYKAVLLFYQINSITSHSNLSTIVENVTKNPKSYNDFKKAEAHASQEIEKIFEQNSKLKIYFDNISSVYAMAYSYLKSNTPLNESLLQDFILKKLTKLKHEKTYTYDYQIEIEEEIKNLLIFLSINEEIIINEMEKDNKLYDVAEKVEEHFDAVKTECKDYLENFNDFFNLDLKPPSSWTPYIIKGTFALATIAAIFLGAKFLQDSNLLRFLKKTFFSKEEDSLTEKEAVFTENKILELYNSYLNSDHESYRSYLSDRINELQKDIIPQTKWDLLHAKKAEYEAITNKYKKAETKNEIKELLNSFFTDHNIKNHETVNMIAKEMFDFKL